MRARAGETTARDAFGGGRDPPKQMCPLGSRTSTGIKRFVLGVLLLRAVGKHSDIQFTLVDSTLAADGMFLSSCVLQ